MTHEERVERLGGFIFHAISTGCPAKIPPEKAPCESEKGTQQECDKCCGEFIVAFLSTLGMVALEENQTMDLVSKGKLACLLCHKDCKDTRDNSQLCGYQMQRAHEISDWISSGAAGFRKVQKEG